MHAVCSVYVIELHVQEEYERKKDYARSDGAHRWMRACIENRKLHTQDPQQEELQLHLVEKFCSWRCAFWCHKIGIETVGRHDVITGQMHGSWHIRIPETKPEHSCTHRVCVKRVRISPQMQM